MSCAEEPKRGCRAYSRLTRTSVVRFVIFAVSKTLDSCETRHLGHSIRFPHLDLVFDTTPVRWTGPLAPAYAIRLGKEYTLLLLSIPLKYEARDSVVGRGRISGRIKVVD